MVKTTTWHTAYIQIYVCILFIVGYSFVVISFILAYDTFIIQKGNSKVKERKENLYECLYMLLIFIFLYWSDFSARRRLVSCYLHSTPYQNNFCLLLPCMHMYVCACVQCIYLSF